MASGNGFYHLNTPCLIIGMYGSPSIQFLIVALVFGCPNRVSVIILKDPEAAFQASILFCFNPASIFYSSM